MTWTDFAKSYFDLFCTLSETVIVCKRVNTVHIYCKFQMKFHHVLAYVTYSIDSRTCIAWNTE